MNVWSDLKKVIEKIMYKQKRKMEENKEEKRRKLMKNYNLTNQKPTSELKKRKGIYVFFYFKILGKRGECTSRVRKKSITLFLLKWGYEKIRWKNKQNIRQIKVENKNKMNEECVITVHFKTQSDVGLKERDFISISRQKRIYSTCFQLIKRR